MFQAAGALVSAPGVLRLFRSHCCEKSGSPGTVVVWIVESGSAMMTPGVARYEARAEDIETPGERAIELICGPFGPCRSMRIRASSALEVALSRHRTSSSSKYGVRMGRRWDLGTPSLCGLMVDSTLLHHAAAGAESPAAGSQWIRDRMGERMLLTSEIKAMVFQGLV